MRFAAVARVTESHWTACAVYDDIQFGLQPGGELVLETTICNEIRQSGKPVVFGHASTHPIFASHATPALYGFESYISVPIVRGDGRFFGTLCAIDPLPAKLDDPHVLQTLELFAQLIAAQLDADDRLLRTDAELSASHDRAKLREQFIAVLGHDLRSPLNAVRTGARFMIEKGEALDPGIRRSAEIIDRGAQRMAGLIDDVLDFARGRLGGGLDVRMEITTTLPQTITHVVTEVQTAWPGRVIESTLRFDGPVRCDPGRVAQLLTNLLSNALAHGDGAGPVRVTASGTSGGFELSVSNTGTAIPEATRRRLFLPFTRAEDGDARAGLGLGLYIASEIARAHGGSLDVASDDAETRFTFRIPASAATA
jgi:signal transduction histidine kinase